MSGARVAIGTVDSEDTLKAVLAMCYRILGERYREMAHYTYADWLSRLGRHSSLLLYAHDGGRVVAAVLGRVESPDSLIVGFVACEAAYRRQGITRGLLAALEANAREAGFKHMTLGAQPDAEAFYVRCGYACIQEMHGQKVFQKVLAI